MARYLVERTFPEDFVMPSAHDGQGTYAALVANNALEGVTWLHSYYAPDRRKSFCICEAETPEAVRRAAQRNGWPVDRITEVRTLDPYIYRAEGGA